MSSKKGFFYTITALHPEVTGSCLLVTVHYPDGNKMMFIVDCGLFQEKPYTQLNNQVLPFTSSKIEFWIFIDPHIDSYKYTTLLEGGIKISSGFCNSIRNMVSKIRLQVADLFRNQFQ